MNEGCGITASAGISANNSVQQSVAQSSGRLADGRKVTPAADSGRAGKLPVNVSDKPLIPKKSLPPDGAILPTRKANIVKIEDYERIIDGAFIGLRTVGDLASLDAPRSGFHLYNGGNYLSDTAPGLVGYAVIFGLIQHKISRLEQRSAAFCDYHGAVQYWQTKENVRATDCTVADLRDYALITRLYHDPAADPLRQVLAQADGHLADDGAILALADSLIALCTEAELPEPLSIPDMSAEEPVASQLKQWQKRFVQKSNEYIVGSKDGSAGGNRLLKMGHQSKKLMREFNAIVKPLGVALKFRTLPLRKFGKSSLAVGHRLVIDESKLHRYLARHSRLPSQRHIKEQVLLHREDGPALKLFANYERRRLRHQKLQWVATAAAAVSAFLPLGKLDYAVRSFREFREVAYREKNLQILDDKLVKLSRFFADRTLRLHSPEAGALRGILEEACVTIRAKKDRTGIKKAHAATQGALDVGAALAGSAIAITFPGIGGVASDAGFGAAKLVAATSAIGIRASTDRKNQQSGRIETKVYVALKRAHNDAAASEEEKRELVSLARLLFDLTEAQVLLLFRCSDDGDLVTAKGLIRPRFNNTPLELPDEEIADRVQTTVEESAQDLNATPTVTDRKTDSTILAETRV